MSKRRSLQADSVGGSSRVERLLTMIIRIAFICTRLLCALYRGHLLSAGLLFWWDSINGYGLRRSTRQQPRSPGMTYLNLWVLGAQHWLRDRNLTKARTEMSLTCWLAWGWSVSGPANTSKWGLCDGDLFLVKIWDVLSSFRADLVFLCILERNSYDGKSDLGWVIAIAKKNYIVLLFGIFIGERMGIWSSRLSTKSLMPMSEVLLLLIRQLWKRILTGSGSFSYLRGVVVTPLGVYCSWSRAVRSTETAMSRTSFRD